MANRKQEDKPTTFYNPDVKLKFLASVPDKDKKKSERYLLRSSLYEEKVKKDISQMNKEELIELMTQQKFIALPAIYAFWLVIKKYLVWYCANVEIIPAYWTVISGRDIRAETYVREVFVEDIDEICALNEIIPVSCGRPFVPILILSYYGINIANAINLNRKNVILQDGYTRVFLDNNLVEIRGDAANILKEYDSVSMIKNDPTRKKLEIKRIYDDKFIYRLDLGRETSTDMRRTTISEMAKLRSKYSLGVKYTATNALVAGRMNSYREYERTHGPLTDEYICERVKLTDEYTTLAIDSDRLFYDACKKALWVE